MTICDEMRDVLDRWFIEHDGDEIDCAAIAEVLTEIFRARVVDPIRDARTTLAKTATGRIGSDELTISRQFFDSAIRNLDAALIAENLGDER